MRKLLIVLFLTGVFCTSYVQAGRVVGYLPSWAGNVSTIQYSKLTHINYSFLIPKSDGTFYTIDNSAKLTNLVSLGHASNVKIFIAVGGWDITPGPGGEGNDAPFATMAANTTYRKEFVDSVMSFVYHYDLDGVDIDWEYPSSVSEANNFVLLMTELADTLHEVGKELSAAVYAGGTGTVGDYIYDQVFDAVDFLNIMAYDNCCGGSHSSYNFATSSLDYWTSTRGLAAEKAILGVPFYGKSPSMSYNSIVTADPTAANRDYYISGPNTIYYNGIPTMIKKAKYAKNNGGGIMIWELSQDASGANSLLSAIYSITPVFKPTSNDFELVMYPNPSKDNLYISAIINGYATMNISVYDAMGTKVREIEVYGNDAEIAVADLIPGVYTIKIVSGELISHDRFVKE